jgi:hypothetical protein
MSSPLPCFQNPPTCHLYDYLHKCRSHREIKAGMRDVEWILEHERCPELTARAEGWEVPCES